jgi:hypothetical protein
VKSLENVVAHRMIEMDEHVPAHDDVEERKGGRREEVVDREFHAPLHVGHDAILLPLRLEIFPPDLRGDVLDLAGRIDSLARDCVCLFRHIGAVHLEREIDAVGSKVPQDENGETVCLLARRAAGAPNADRSRRRMKLPRNYRRQDILRNGVEYFGIPEEFGDMNRNGIEELFDLPRIAREIGHVIIQCGELQDRHPERNPALETRKAIVREILPELRLEVGEKLAHAHLNKSHRYSRSPRYRTNAPRRRGAPASQGSF